MQPDLNWRDWAGPRVALDEPERFYLLWIRTLVPAVFGLAMLFVALAIEDEGLVVAALLAIATSAIVGAATRVLAPRIGYHPIVAVVILVDVFLIAAISAGLGENGSGGVAYVWPIVAAAMLLSTRSAIAVALLTVVVSAVAALNGGLADSESTAVYVVTLAAVGVMVSLLRVHDVRTARERDELATRLQEAQRMASIGSFEFDSRDGVRWSDEMYRIFGVEHGEELGRSTFLDILDPLDRDRVVALLQDLGASGQDDVAFELTIRRPDGEMRILHAITSRKDTRDRQRLVGTVQDVTHLRRLDELHDEFVAAASHELRTPTSIVLGFASTLTSRWDELADSDRLRFVGEIDEAARRLSMLVEDVLQVSQIESGRVRCERERFDVVAEMRDLAATWPAVDGFHLDVDAGDAPELFAVGDVIRTRQVMTNLVSNAERYSGRVLIRVRLRGEMVEIEVIDHGPGIDPSEQERIFERFVRLDSETVGTGLGLYISRRLAEAQGGTLGVHSVPGEGATFTYALPSDPGMVDA